MTVPIEKFIRVQPLLRHFENVANHKAGVSISLILSYAGVERRTWRSWKSGQRLPTLRSLRKIHDTLNVFIRAKFTPPENPHE